MFEKISLLIDEMNQDVLGYCRVKLEKQEESTFVSGCGHRKSIYQKQYQELQGYLERLKTYANHIEVCGDERNCYFKTDHVAAFMRIKRDYMGNDPLGHYPKYPVAVDGYGSYNDYLYCEEHEMEKYMKFTMFKKETLDKRYHENPYRAVNFKRDEVGNLICPNGKSFHFKSKQHVYKNKYGRTEEIYECESYEGCQHKNECCPKAYKNQTIRMNQELIAIHQETVTNLESIHGALLRMNRSIQAEGTFGILKWNKSYKRLFRREKCNS